MINAIKIIAINTYRESVRSKILYALFFFAVVLVLLALFFGSVTIGDRSQVVASFGLFSVSIFSVAYTIIAGTAFLNKELSKKTIYNILAKPVKRSEFLLGKYFGMLVTTIVIVVLMAFALYLFLWVLDGQSNPVFLQAVYSIILELVILCAVALFFSSIVVTPLLSGAFTFATFLAGRSTSYILEFAVKPDISESLKAVLNILYTILPHLDWINLNDETVYLISASNQHLLYSLLYAISYAGVLLCLANIIFKKREFN